ncbi:glycoside hydrolase family 113 [Flagellimonas zhangzhouensis]|uniref:GTA TIM-barrel-like domain-containing protein n=1 Tax=Flagellimonas zhangzhouensis TaxID=1073328 RepID=A0A1H2VLU0_9FLAO|nr:glycoside hydrolase TIM-barrel-like domain-containing protein [Allomuricauda zhangzhouensis]SDQ06986.1 GTA TIM-barrel-like domain-containing protein [Allomuricauda zhangzhouensis]SDW69282.1 GTA TIM-barrel-like domain-containing protein [Allomuricauda zhangzhouensis]
MNKLIWVLFLVFLSCTSPKPEKVNGISFVGSRKEVAQVHVNPVLDIHANYAAIMPYGFIRDIEAPELVFNTDRQWFGERREGCMQYIKTLHENGVKVMLKPQLWIWRGEFTGHMVMKTEEEWEKFENSYAQFILLYAELAEETQTDIFCIGTELEAFVKNRPEFWNQLIADVRKVYKGKITYAANWDEYDETPFWNQLDYIGVNAYFPLTDDKDPTMQALKEGWKPWKTKLQALVEKENKPIMFTEFGYRSMDFTGKKPWLVDRGEMNVNLQAQADAIQVIFDEFWSEEWFAGGFLWKWFIDHEEVGGHADNRFTPQNKPAELVVRNHFAQGKRTGS